MDRTETWIWSCTDDEDSCPRRREKSGQEWKKKKDVDVWPPLPGCSSPEGCRCEVIGIETTLEGNVVTTNYLS